MSKSEEAFEVWAAGEIRLRPARHIRKDVARDTFKESDNMGWAMACGNIRRRIKGEEAEKTEG